jgi:hypothetical protein
MNTSSLKKEFLIDECWMMAFGAAFQRANVYVARPDNLTDSQYTQQKNEFRTSVRQFIETTLLPKYKEPLTDEEHLKSIQQIIGYTTKSRYSELLSNGRFKFGVAQKLLNLILKYYWCLGSPRTPPHFPVDRIIQELIPNHKMINWTTLDNSNDYMNIVNAARKCLTNDQSLAEWELEIYSRR